MNLKLSFATKVQQKSVVTRKQMTILRKPYIAYNNFLKNKFMTFTNEKYYINRQLAKQL